MANKDEYNKTKNVTKQKYW